ncbi:MAG: MFS transporter [Desulfobacterales bacterium]|nr:MFS transporter [Desulfobacterales bacterium]
MFHFLWVTTLGKLLINTGKRIFYPFAPAIARGLGVEVSAIAALIALNQATSMLAPWIMAKASGYGYRAIALGAFIAALVTFAAMGFFPFYAVILAGVFMLGMAKSIIDPTFQAMVGDHVPEEKRGRAVGIMEVSWSASTLVGIPICGLVMEHYQWQAPFILLAMATLICLAAMFRILPQTPAKASPGIIASLKAMKPLLKDKKAAGLLIYSFCVCLANDNFFVTYGFWLEDTYKLSLASIGLGTIFIGAAEILGELLMAFLADRFGMARTLIWSTLFSAGSFFALMFLDGELYRALAGLFFVFFTFEFSYVTSMALTTELTDKDRGTVISIFFAVRGLGRVIGALSGGLFWGISGITSVCWVSGIVSTIALVALLPGFTRLSRR